MEERILTMSMSDKEQIRNPFHYKKLNYRRARESTSMCPLQGDV